MHIGNYYVGVDCNGDLYEYEDEEKDMPVIDRDFANWLFDMEDCDEQYDNCWDGPELVFA